VNVDPASATHDDSPGNYAITPDRDDGIALAIQAFGREIAHDIGSIQHRLAHVDQLALVDHGDQLIDVLVTERA
jgi:hypothetical protein